MTMPLITLIKNIIMNNVQGGNELLEIVTKNFKDPNQYIASNTTTKNADIEVSFNIMDAKTQKALAYFSVNNGKLFMGKCKCNNLCKKCQTNLEKISLINTCSKANTINNTKALEIAKNKEIIDLQFQFISTCKH